MDFFPPLGQCGKKHFENFTNVYTFTHAHVLWENHSKDHVHKNKLEITEDICKKYIVMVFVISQYPF